IASCRASRAGRPSVTSGEINRRVTHPLQWARSAISRGDSRARLAERVATYLRQQLPEDHVVLALHSARDGARVPIVVIGRDRLVIGEPRDEEGDLLCYQDHWYRSEERRGGEECGVRWLSFHQEAT